MAAHPRSDHERGGTGMNWLTRLLTTPERTKEDERRARDTEKTLSLVDAFKAEVRQDIDHKRRETDLAQSLLRARDQRSAPS